MGAFVAAADRIREASAATVNLVHHTPKEGSTPRGHSALEGAVDTALLLERNGSKITLSMVKQKDGPAVDPMVFELAPVGASVVPVLPRSTATSLELVGAERAVRDLVWQCAGSDGLSSTALLRMAEVPERSFYRAMKVLRDRQIIRNVGTERQPRWAASEDVLPSTAKDCHDTPAVLTATAPPLGGLAVGSTDGFDLDEELF